jgi:hypothetical protein
MGTQTTFEFASYRVPKIRESELGLEKYCFTCGEFWPADEEFFGPSKTSKDRLALRCKACCKAGTWMPHGYRQR